MPVPESKPLNSVRRPCKAGHGGIILSRANEEWGKGAPERASSTDVRGTENGIADALDQPDIGCHAPLAWSDLGQHGSDIRRIRWRTGFPTQAVVHGIEVIADVARVRHRPDQ